MKTILKIALITFSLVLMLITDVPFLPQPVVQEAEAIFGVRRRAHRRGVVMGYAAGEAAASSAAASQQAAAAQQQSTATQQQESNVAPSPPLPSSTEKLLPLGTVVTALPAGCTTKPMGGVEYYHCGDNYYRAVFQGNNLVYVTAKPE